MSDVKKFTGFIAIDGSTHTTLKSATEHSRQVKVQKALEFKFAKMAVIGEEDEPGSAGVDLPTFIYANRDEILACLNQEVLTRKKRAPKAKPEAAAAVAA